MFSVKKLFNALEKLCKEENIDKEKICDIISESLVQAYIKTIFKNKESNLIKEPNIKVLFNSKGTEVNFFLIKKIKKDVNDNLTEISLDEAKKILKNNKLKYDDEISLRCRDFDNKNELEVFSNHFKRIFQKKIDCEEKTVLYNVYKDHINEIVTAKVEKINNRGAMVKIGNINALLPRKAMIGDEFFFVDQQIKVFLEDTSDEKRKSISITRANKGFLEKILKEEIYEIYDGTIVIKNIARIAGKRSKVAVFSTNNDVNATGSCIGKNGIRLAKIVEQLGGNGYDKERVDIVQYSNNDLLFIMNAIRPAEAVGVSIMDGEEKKVFCIVKDGQFLKAVGLNGINVKLAAELTGYELKIIEESEAKNKNIDYVTKKELEQEEISKKEEKKRKEFFEQTLAYKKLDSKNEIEKEKNNDNNESSEKLSDYSLKNNFADMKITSLSDMEKEISSKNNDNKKEKEENNKEKESKNKKHKEIVINDNKNKNDNVNKVIKKMDIYTKEELKQIEEESNEEDNSYKLKDFDKDLEEFDDYYKDN